MKTLEKLQVEDWIAFDYSYLNDNDKTPMVANITSIRGNECLVHFLWGHHSVGEYIESDDIIAIGDNKNGKDKIKGWSGSFIALKQEHPSIEYGHWK